MGRRQSPPQDRGSGRGSFVLQPRVRLRSPRRLSSPGGCWLLGSYGGVVFAASSWPFRASEFSRPLGSPWDTLFTDCRVGCSFGVPSSPEGPYERP